MNLVEMEDAYGQNQDSLEEQLDQIDHPLQQVDQIDHTLQQPNPTQPIEHPVPQEQELELLFHLDPFSNPANMLIPSDEQSTLRRSARISEKGFTKNYTPKKTRKKKQPRGKGSTDSKELHATILMSLQAELLATDPLNQIISDEVDRICGIEISEDLLTTAAGPNDHMLNLEDYGESILGELEFDSNDDKLSDDDLGLDEDGH